MPIQHPARSGSNALELPDGRFRPRAGVLTARALDAMAMYDPGTERYYTLNSVGTRIWELLDEEQPPARIVDRLCDEYTAPREQVIADVATQIAAFLQDRLIEPSTCDQGVRRASGNATRRFGAAVDLSDLAAPVGAEVRVPSVLRCAVAISRIKWLLRTRFFEATIAWIRARVENVPASSVAEVEKVRAVEYAVAMAAALYPGRARCLEQSLTLYYLLRRRGVAVKYCQGAQPYPFQAHAWIEYQGQIINDVPEHVQAFARFPERLP